MRTLKDKELRDVYEKHIREHMLGPGYAKEIILCSDDASDEILDQDPLDIYSTGILYPQKAKSYSEITNDVQEDVEEEDEGSQNGGADDRQSDDDDDDDNNKSSAQDDKEEVHDDASFEENDRMGLITCVPLDAKSIKVKVSYAKYEKMPKEERKKVKILLGEKFYQLKDLLDLYDYDPNESVKNELNRVGWSGNFSDLIKKDEERRAIWIEEAITINKSKLSVKPKEGLGDLDQLLKMLFSDFYRRKVFSFEQEIDISEVYSDDKPLSEFDEVEDFKVFKKVFIKDVKNKGKKKYIKILVRNAMEITSDNSKMAKSMFQPELVVTPLDCHLDSYTEPVQMKNDTEGNTIEFIYREVNNYGKGIRCAVEWEEDGSSIRTSFMPTMDVKKFSTKLDKEKDEDYCKSIGIDADEINECCKLYNLSHWGATNLEAYFERLNKFVDGYSSWCERQGEKAKELNREDITEGIIKNQKKLLSRLKDNVQYLMDHKIARECFKWANTAMLIQMTIARNDMFKKNRDVIKKEDFPNLSLNWFEENERKNITKKKDYCAYYPFQLAFLLMNVKSTFEEDDEYRNKKVDLIWFPTGGGKTEAYLALTALTIIARRRDDARYERPNGVSVLMRYTLRLLTSQQFERASYLICALEFLRQKQSEIKLGDQEISIGLWIGGNQRENLTDTHGKWYLFDHKEPNERTKASNPYPITYCPWCGKKLVPSDTTKYGYRNGKAKCTNDNCLFNSVIPVHFVTEDVENAKPTLLFATVDKLAGLTRNGAAMMFGYGNDNIQPLDLIIQDELHLISGPLGSIVGFFECVVEKIATKCGRKPKIVASTATTRNTNSLIKNLYNQREVQVFPAQGLTYDDNYFSHVEKDSLRRHIGICPQCRPVTAEIRLVSQMLLARVKVIREALREQKIDLSNQKDVLQAVFPENTLLPKLDNFWTQVLYYNSLKDLGRMHSRVGQEVMQMVRAQQRYLQIPKSLKFALQGIDNRVKEFTSREDSSRIKDLLTQAETKAKVQRREDDSLYIDYNTIDLVLASNMISVGIDIGRWNVMMMSGQPRTISEYIQSSSRVGRSAAGLVINEYSPMRIREKSMFENFTSFHAAYYKYVEPLSATPVTKKILDHNVFNNVIECYKSYFSGGMNELQAQEHLLNDLKSRFFISPELASIINDLIESKWKNQLEFATSLRDIDKDCYTSINQIQY